MLCFLLPSDIVFWAACLIGFFGFLRKKTLLPMSLANPGDSCILRGDLSMDELFVFNICVRKTKTIQCGERLLNLPYVACQDSPLCPYQALCDLLLVAPKDPKLPLFSYKKNGSNIWWTHSAFTGKLKNLIKWMGLNQSQYSGHSFRRGGASLGFELGLSLTEIKEGATGGVTP